MPSCAITTWPFSAQAWLASRVNLWWRSPIGRLPPPVGQAGAAGSLQLHLLLWFCGIGSTKPKVGPAMAKNAMTPEEQLEDLQRRFQLLEGESLWPFRSLRDSCVRECWCALGAQERKATYETAKLNIQQNKDSSSSSLAKGVPLACSSDGFRRS